MKFKHSDKVHVTRLNSEKVDFYATLKETGADGVFYLIDCTNYRYEGVQVYTPKTKDFGPDKQDYYTLATDEKNVRELLIENKKLKKEIEKLEEDNEQLCKLGYEIYKELFKYRRLTDNIRHKYETKPGRYSDLMDLINEMEDK